MHAYMSHSDKPVRLPKEFKRKIIGETFIDLFENEAIRIENEAKGTPNAGKVSWPGNGVRVLGDLTAGLLAVARKTDHIFISMIREAGIYNEMSLAYAGLDTDKAVGVTGNTRVYGYIVILCAVTTSDVVRTPEGVNVIGTDSTRLSSTSGRAPRVT
ncbi:hypothetical protein E4U42_000756 [Claviceps africana]|uniref:GMP synthase C-terminal domain-containing protein n=1 Tax=Claviceps africana TaxID=83212 RepID=A0A8K0JCB4_9HYPO|nr:hypothetical protein E4U42_000756 [Claviceps africana]